MALLHVGASPAVYTDFPSHRHDCYEIILNVEGTGTARIGEREYPFSPGTIQVIPPGTPHRKWAEKGFRDLYLHTDTLRCSAAPGEADPDGPLLLADDASRTMEHLLSVLLGRFSLGMERDEISRILLDTVLRLIADWSRTEPADPVVGAVLRRIQEGYSDPEFRVTEALLETGYSKDHLRRRFQQTTGTTPNKYLKELRLRHARQLLDQNDTLHLSIGEISLLCGFYDPAYFCRSFQAETGMSPTAYMKTGK